MARLELKLALDAERDDPIATYFDDDSDGAVRFYTLFGRLLAIWGRIEMGLIHTLETVWHLYPEGVPDKIPHELKRRTDLIKLIFRSVPDLEPFRSAASRLSSEARSMARKRNFMYHSTFWNFSVSTIPEAIFYDLSPNSAKTGKYVRFSEKDILRIIGDIGILSMKLSIFQTNVALHLRGLGKERQYRGRCDDQENATVTG